MKIEKSNNPVAVGALSIAFLGALLYAFKGMFGGNEVVAAPAKNDRPQNPIAAPKTGKLKGISTGTDPNRDPFSHEILFVKHGKSGAAIATMQSGPSISTGIDRKGERLPSLEIRPMEVNGVRNGTPQVPGPQPASGQSTVYGNENSSDRVSKCSLTAIIGGIFPAAVVEKSNGFPRILHVGDTLEDMKITSINRESITLHGPTGICLLTLRVSDAHDADNAVKEDRDAQK